MAAISRTPFCLSFSSSQCRKPFSYLHHQQQQLCTSERNSRNKHRFICFACSIKRTRVRKKVKSEEELRGEIMDFIAFVGLPEDHVPSLKELSDHGRHDLANIVRRRGYKFVRELVANPKIEDLKELASKKAANVKHSAGGACEQDALAEGQDESAQGMGAEDLPSSELSSMVGCSDASDCSTSRDWDNKNSEKQNVIPILTPKDDESSLVGFSSAQNFAPGLVDLMHSNLDDNSYSGGIKKDDLVTESAGVNDAVDNEISSSEAPISGKGSLVLDEVPSCSDKEDDSISMTKEKEFHDVGNDASSSVNISTHKHYTSPDFNSNDMSEMFGDSSITSSVEEKVTRFIQDGYLDTIEENEHSISNESDHQETEENKETYDLAKVQLMSAGHDYVDDNHSSRQTASMVSNGNALALEEVTSGAVVNRSHRDDLQRYGNGELDEDLLNEDMKRENQVEISHLKFLLHQKESELSQLKDQIEEEKLALSLLQRKAETEIDNAQKLVLEKDAELQAAEGSLSGLKEVEIEYCGDGEFVEVTGSFNGWQHRVEMDIQSSNGIGNQRRWSTILWLYPGKYEIKFIVDGQWKIDPQKESVTRGHITNNILKVDG